MNGHWDESDEPDKDVEYEEYEDYGSFIEMPPSMQLANHVKAFQTGPGGMHYRSKFMLIDINVKETSDGKGISITNVRDDTGLTFVFENWDAQFDPLFLEISGATHHQMVSGIIQLARLMINLDPVDRSEILAEAVTRVNGTTFTWQLRGSKVTLILGGSECAAFLKAHFGGKIVLKIFPRLHLQDSTVARDVFSDEDNAHLRPWYSDLRSEVLFWLSYLPSIGQGE